MNIKVLSLTEKSKKNDKTEYSKELEREFTSFGANVKLSEVKPFIPLIEYDMIKCLNSETDYIVIANALERNSEQHFRKLFAGIINRGEAKVQPKPYTKPKKPLKDKLSNAIKKAKTIPNKIKGLKNLFSKDKKPAEKPLEMPYNKKKTHIFSIETSIKNKTAYCFSYRGTRALVLPKGIDGKEAVELLEKSKEVFSQNSEEFPNGYRLIPKVYKVLSFTQKHFPQSYDSINEKIRKLTMLGAFCVFIVASCMFIYNLVLLPMENDAITSDIQTVFYSGDSNSANGKTAKKRNWSKLIKINSDIKAWIKIKDTQVDYPVLQHKADDKYSQYYLTHNYKKEYSQFGSIFIDYRSKQGVNSKNIVLHGHHMINGSMFGDLMKYGDRSGGNLSFYKKSPVIQFSTPKGKTSTYKIISVFKSNVNTAQGEYFDFYCSSFKNSAQFMNYVYNLRIRSLINCPVTTNEDDQLLTLVTCSYEFNNFRTVVVARKCRAGESEKVNTSTATLNKSSIWPQCYYSSNGTTRPTISTFRKALKAHKISWFDGNKNLKGSEDLPYSYTKPTEATKPTKATTAPTEAVTETTKPKEIYYTAKIYAKGKLISKQKVKKGGKVKIPKISKTFVKNGYKYKFKGWKHTKGRNYKKLNGNINIKAVYTKKKIVVQKPTVKPTKATKPVQKPTKPVATVQPTTESEE